jgi:two-component system response regulator DesR
MAHLRVVLIDDEDDVRRVMEEMLRLHLPDIVEVRSFRPEDVDGIDWGGCQVAIVDLMMPGRDGESILAELQEKHPGVYRVAWTAKSREARDALAETGLADAVIAKPGFEEVIGLIPRARK